MNVFLESFWISSKAGIVAGAIITIWVKNKGQPGSQKDVEASLYAAKATVWKAKATQRER